MTFDHLFILGLNRDLFPRVVREDALLADDLRQALVRILPDTPIKSRGHHEERYLFAQLLSAAPEITLSWQSADDEGRARAPSPLLADLFWGENSLAEPHRAPPLLAPPALAPAADGTSDHELLRPAAEHAMLAGLYGTRERFEQTLPLVLEAREADEGRRGETSARLARALSDGLRELEPGFPEPPPGPFFGYLGAHHPGDRDTKPDPRSREIWVTHLERLVACPWQTFLERFLRLAPPPDPLAALPELTPLLVGQLVHAALEAVVRRAPGERMDPRAATLAQALETAPLSVPWPDDESLELLVLAAARELLVREGIGLEGLARPLARRARPYLDAARENLWPVDGTPLAVWGAELTGAVELSTGTNSRRLFFRGDLLARRGEEALVIDWKTGSPLSTAVKEETRQRHLAAGVAQGRWLQAVAYALSEESGAGLGGAYLFLRPQIAPEHRVASVASGNALRAPFEAAVTTALTAWDEGTFFPRLVDPKTLLEPGRCSWCAVSEACLRGDSGSRRRLVEAAEKLTAKLAENETSEVPLARHERAFLDLWNLPLASATVDRDTP